MRDNRLLPFWLPFAVIGVVALVLTSFGMTLLSIAFATYSLIPGLHSGVVIVVALIVSFLIGGAASLYAGGPSGTAGRRPPTHDE